MALTQADLDALDKAISGGILEVEYDGNKVKYRSMADLLRAREHVRSSLNPDARSSAENRRYAETSRGL